MNIRNRIIDILFCKRRKEIDYFRHHAAEIQFDQLRRLIKYGCDTEFGRDRSFESIDSIEKFQQNVSVCDYDNFSHFIDRTREGESKVIWPTDIKWYAKSSGTTGSNSKFIPVSDQGLWDSHMQGPRDTICIFSALYPDNRVYYGKTLTLGGSHRIEPLGHKAQAGDLSAILIENTPVWANLMRVPKPATALIADFEQKVSAICRETVAQNVTSFAGVPSWNLVLMNKVLEYTGKQNLLEVWPNLELFIHGGMNFKPYAEQYHRLIPSDRMKYMETYNASEGFFAIQDDPSTDDMLLMLDYGIFYEFLPTEHLGDTSKAIPLEDVRTGVNYAMIITTTNGLWRYQIGDTVEFTSTNPYKIRITGRTKLFINAFGEEVIIDNAERALRKACEQTGADIADYTAAPVYMDGKSRGRHQWVIEFRTPPSDMSQFTEQLDKALQSVNSDYEAKRFKNVTLDAPVVTSVPEGTFYQWMKTRGKIGGQNKVPRLYNDRTFVEQLLSLAETGTR